MNFLEKHATKRNIILGIIFIIFINTIAFPFFPKIMIGREIPIDGIFDLQFGFTIDFANQILLNLQDDGRNAYKYSTLFVDIPYALVYGFIYSFMLIALIRKTKLWKFKYLVLIPFGISVFDLIENIGILTMLSSYPTMNETVCEITSFANQGKWSFAILFFLVFIILLIGNYKFKGKNV